LFKKNRPNRLIWRFAQQIADNFSTASFSIITILKNLSKKFKKFLRLVQRRRSLFLALRVMGCAFCD
jgi:hypothetical protein